VEHRRCRDRGADEGRQPLLRLHRPALLAITAGIVGGVAVQPALAHVEVKSTSPARGSVASTSIRVVKVTFTGPIRGGTLRVKGPGGRVVSIGSGHRAPNNINRLRVSLRRSLDPGRYRARWTATSADGHAEDGAFRFRLRD
jgi:methionine-rich copper-binding protein CopC